MEVILLEKIRNLGNLGDAVNVKAGYGRNYLLPHGKAVAATAANLKLVEKRRVELEQRAAEQLAVAQKRADKLNDLKITINALASDEGKLYGSVGANEIAKSLAEKNIEIEKREVIMPEGPIHSVGEFDVSIQVHSDIIASIKVEIVPMK